MLAKHDTTSGAHLSSVQRLMRPTFILSAIPVLRSIICGFGAWAFPAARNASTPLLIDASQSLPFLLHPAAARTSIRTIVFIRNLHCLAQTPDRTATRLAR